jgi:hypothetical protein
MVKRSSSTEEWEVIRLAREGLSFDEIGRRVARFIENECRSGSDLLTTNFIVKRTLWC